MQFRINYEIYEYNESTKSSNHTDEAEAISKLVYDKKSYLRSCLAFDRILIKCGISTYLQSRRLIQAQKIDKRKKAFTTKMQWFLVVQFTMSLSAFLL